jgi:hypothetical protein
MATQDEEIARYLREAAASGELSRLPGYGKPMTGDDGFEATPDEFRMPFKILKNAGFTPPEIEWFHQRAALQAQLQAAQEPQERAVLSTKLSELQQKIALRLEAMRVRGS